MTSILLSVSASYHTPVVPKFR